MVLVYSLNISPRRPELRFQPLLTSGALSCFWAAKKEKKTTNKHITHGWQSSETMRELVEDDYDWRRVVVSRPPPHYTDTEGLLHNLGGWLLCIIHQRHQTWQARRFSRYQLHGGTHGTWPKNRCAWNIVQTLTTLLEGGTTNVRFPRSNRAKKI